MRAVNLLPRDAAKQRKSLAHQNVPVLVGAGMGVVVTGALALGFLHESSAVTAAQKQLLAAKAELAKTPRPAQVTVKPDPNAALAGQEAPMVSAVSTALGARVAWDRILREFSLVLPDDVTLTSLALTAPTSAATTSTAGPATGLTIAGNTYSHDSVARLLARLALIPELSDVTLQSDSSAAAVGTAGTTPGAASGPAAAAPISFTIAAAIQAPPGLAALTPAPPAPPPPPSTDSTDTGASS